MVGKVVLFSEERFRALADDYIHNERYRKILIDRYCNDMTFEQVAEQNNYSVRQVKNIVYRYGDRLLILLQKG